MGQCVSTIINAFTAGELSRHLEGRTDHEKYYNGCRRLENFIPRPQGSVYKRPGTRFVNHAKYSQRPARLLPFDFNSTASQSYIIEMGHEYLRFYKDGGVILGEDGEPYEIASPWTQTMLGGVNTVQSCDVLFMVHPEVQPHRLTRSGHAKWALEPMEFKAPGHDYVIEDTNADTLCDGRQGDTMSVAAQQTFESSMLVQARLEDGGEACWFCYKGDGMWDADDEALTLTFRDSPDLDADEVESVHASDGTLRELYWEAVDFDHSMPEDWADENWPGCVALYEDRLVLAATPTRPLSLWLSRTGEYEDLRLNTAPYTDGVQDSPLDDDAIEIALSGARINPVRWIMDQEVLLVGTNSSELKVWSGSEGQGMTPAKVQRKRQSAHGSAALPAQMVSNAVLFVSRSMRKVRELSFDVSSYRYVAPDLTILADHVTGPGVVAMDYAREPDGVLWVVRADGVLAGCTYLPEQNVVAWHRHLLGGDGYAESVACIPGEFGDEVWLVVRRTLGGEVRRTVERLIAHDPDDQSSPFLMDCGLTSGLALTGAFAENPVRLEVPGHSVQAGQWVRVLGVSGMTELNGIEAQARDVTADGFSLVDVDGSGFGAWTCGGTVWPRINEISGLDHLEGENVRVVADGGLRIDTQVLEGKVVLDRPAWQIQAGFGYESVLQPMRLEVGGSSGTSQTRRKRVMGVTVRFLDTVGGRICPGDDRADKFERILPHVQPALAGVCPEPFSGDREVKLAGGFDRDGLFTIRQDDPLPMTVVCCVPRVQGGD